MSFPSKLTSSGNTIGNNGDKIVFAGDSITAGDAATQRSYPIWFDLITNKTYQVVNAGVSGDSSSQLLARFDNDIIVQNPKYCCILIGRNDLSNNSNYYKLVDNIDSMVAKCLNNGIVPILITPPPYGNIAGQAFTATAQQLLDHADTCRLIVSFAKSAKLKYIDLYNLYQNNSYISQYYTYDNIHPTYNFCIAIAREIAHIFNKASLSLVSNAGNKVANYNMLDTDSNGLPDGWNVYQSGVYTVTHKIDSQNGIPVFNFAAYAENPSSQYAMVNIPVSNLEIGVKVVLSVDVKNTQASAGNALYGYVVRVVNNGSYTMALYYTRELISDFVRINLEYTPAATTDTIQIGCMECNGKITISNLTIS